MKEFVISDLHFLHNNCAKHRGFNSADEMNEHIIEKWNNVVKKNDIVYVLGDISIDAKTSRLAPILTRLNGKIILINGNHDRSKTIDELISLGLILRSYDMLYASILYNGVHVKVHFLHYPLVCWRKMEHGSYHLHGHVHGKYEGEGKTADCSWEVLGEPKLIQDILLYCDNKSIKNTQQNNEI